MRELLPYLINGISVGGQYALIAIGYTLVYGILRLINFAHGDVFMVAGLIMVYTTASMPMYISIPLVLIFTVILGFAIERVAYACEKKLLKRVELFDVYEGKNLEEGKKSYAINLTLQDTQKTMSDKQTDAIMQKIIRALETQVGAKLR